MQGELRTALSGRRVESIPVVYLGRYRDAVGPGRDLLLVRIEGALGERVGVAAGMSGSPVFFGDQLVGALSYRLGVLPKEGVAGVTPIEDLLDAGAPEGAVASRLGPDDGVRPIATPVVATGFLAPVIREVLQPALEPYGLQVMAGGRTGTPAPAAPVPGSPVGVELLRGAMSLAATGTVTWVEGGTVYAFGHPFLGTGPVRLPMTDAEVVYTLPALGGSSKLANVGREIGAILQDRLTAVVGRMGETVAMVPLHVHVRPGDGAPKSFEFEYAPDPTLGALVAGAAVANALLLDVGFESEVTVRGRAEVSLDDGSSWTLPFADASDDRGHPYVRLAIAVQTWLGAIHRNPYRPAGVRDVRVDLESIPGRRTYQVRGLHLDRGLLAPGSVLDVTVRLRPYRGEERTVSVPVRLPSWARPGSRFVILAGEPGWVDRQLGRIQQRRLASADSLEAWLRAFSAQAAGDRVQVVLAMEGRGVVRDARVLEDVPPSLGRLLSLDEPLGQAARIGWSVLDRQEVATDGPVKQGARAVLEVGPAAALEETEP